jgi:hypothetical protein
MLAGLAAYYTLLLPAAGQPIHVVATLTETPGQSLAFQQVPEGVRIMSVADAPPTTIMLPANEMAKIPSPGMFTASGHRRLTGRELCRGNSKGCDTWLGRAMTRHKLLGRLVSRRFELSGSAAYVETMSTRVAGQLAESDGALRPLAVPLLSALSRGGFDVLIPWEAMPPQSSLRMESVSVRLIGGAGGRVTSYVVHLGNPRQHVYTPCHLPLTALIERGDFPYAEYASAFYLPQLGDQLPVVYAWEDPWDGWEWSQPALQLHRQPSMHTKVGEDAWICGPILKHRRGEAETSTGKPGAIDKLDAGGFEVVRLPEPDAGFLALSRPRLHSFHLLGVGGSCAGAETVSWWIHQVLPLPEQAGKHDGRVRTVLDRSFLRLRCAEKEPVDYEVEFTPDLLTVTEYEAYRQVWYLDGPVTWRTRTFIWRDGKYAASAWKASPAPASSALRRKQRRW